MLDETAFLRTILENPDDDGPRLVYADWLEETGETARAEFVRVQLELARLPDGDSQHESLVDREQALLKRFRRRWMRRVGEFVRDARFVRGTMDFARLTGADFVRHGSRLFDRAPVTQLRLSNATDELARVGDMPALQWLRALDIGYNGLSATRIPGFLRSEHFLRLRSLDVSANSVGASVRFVELLAECFPQLEALNVSRTGMTMESLHLLAAYAPPRLAHLTLDSNRLLPHGLLDFVDTELLDRLRSLSLQGTGIGDNDIYALADCRRLAHLTSLNVSSNAISDDGAVALAQAESLAALETLDLSYNEIGQRGALAIAHSRYFDDLTRLVMHGNRVGRAAVEMLRRRFGNRVEGLSPAR